MNIAIDSHKQLLSNLKKYIEETLNVEYRTKKLVVEDVLIPDIDYRNEDIKKQKASKIEGLTHSDPVKAKIALYDSGKLVERKTLGLFDIPRVTKRGTYIVKGTEYSFPIQKRLIPGVYTREHEDGKISAWINSSKGRNMTVSLRTGGDFVLDIQNSNINLHAVLLGLGVTPEAMRRAWGQDVYNTNANSRDAKNPLKALKKVYAKLQYAKNEPEPKGIEEYRKWISNYFKESSEMDPENVEITLGSAESVVSAKLFLLCAIKILSVSRGESNEDNKESLIHNHVKDISDFVIERLQTRQYRASIKRTIQKGLRSYESIRQIIPKSTFNAPIESTFTQTALARSPKQNNPMDMHSDFTEVTVRGEGGIGSIHAVTRDVRAVDPSHFAFLDPIHTPEGENIGTTVHLAQGARKKGDTLVSRFIDIKTRKEVELSPRQVFKSKILFREFYKNSQIVPKDGRVKIMHRGEVLSVKPSEAQYVVRSASDMLDINTLAIPFLSHNNGTRAMTGAKMQSQAKPLLYREAPLVQAGASEREGTRSIESIVGNSSTPKSPVDGTVLSASKNQVVIRDKSGKRHEVEMPHHLWLNESNYTEITELKVKAGDKVKSGQILADTNYTKDGTLSLGTNLKTAYVSYKGLNYEDGVVVSESGAKKLTSLHAHQHKVPVTDTDILNKKSFRAYFPTKFTSEQMERLDDDGIIKVGQKLQLGDPMVVKMRKTEEDTLSKKLKNISRLLVQDFRDSSQTWPKKTPGEVVEVHRRKDDIFIVVKTQEKAKVGDKLVGRYGNKGTITIVLPDSEMPKDEKGEVMDLLLNPDGVISRMNIGQILETTASRIAKKDKKPYVAKPFGGKYTERILKELKQKGLKDHGTLYDPVEKKNITGVLHGHQYILKLEHQVEKKLSARGAGITERYSETTGQPGRGGGTGGQSIGLMEVYALLAHGADANLAEMFTFKGNKSLEAWRAIENGTFLPPPEVPESSRRFVSMLKGMGINVEEKGRNVKLAPFLDKDVKKISNGEIKDATRLRAKDLKEEKGGIFDISITGGIVGEKYGHIQLAEPLPHPTFEKAILDVTHLKKDDFLKVVKGQLGVLKGELVDPDTRGSKTGGLAIKEMLSSIKIDKRLKEIAETAPKKKGSDLNKLHREARTLRNFKDNKIKLSDMVVSKVPVIPPKYRGIIELPNGNLTVADINEHYTATILMNNQVKSYGKRPGLIEEKRKAVGSLYEGFKGISGMGDGLVDKPNVKGFAKTIAGSSPKYGWYLSNMLKRRQDVSGRGVVSPDPKLDMDSLGIPENMAWSMFKPFTIKELKSVGFTSIKAKEEIESKSKMAKDALLRAMESRMVFMNRAPTLHKFSIMAFKPKLVPGSAVRVPIEITSGYNMDFDGDTVAVHVATTNEAVQEAKELVPSRNLFGSGSSDSTVPKLGNEYVLGLFKLTKEVKTTSKRYRLPEEVIRDFKAGKIKHNDIVSVLNIGRTTAGKCLAQSYVPTGMRDYQITLNKKNIGKMLALVAKKSGGDTFKKMISGWKHLGRKYVYLTGSSFLVSDLRLLTKKRNQLYRQADRKAMMLEQRRDISAKEKTKRINKIYQEVDAKIIGQVSTLKKNEAGVDNNISNMVQAGSRGNPNQVKQLVGHLGQMLDHRQQVMREPVRGNIGEGLSSFDFWQHTYAQRKGMIDKSQSVSGPGQLSKEMTNSGTRQVISMPDCGTNHGMKESVDRHIIDRLLAKPYIGMPKNTIITDDVISKLEKAGVKSVEVRSIFSCEANVGVCSKCFGVDEFGSLPRIGKRVGITDIQAITERTTQLPMKSFHTGGVASAEGGMANAFDRAVQILRVPENIKRSATLASVTGIVNSVKKSGYGGYVVTIAGKEHKVSKGLTLSVKVGDTVQKGQPISGGVIKPQELLGLTNVSAVQRQMRDDLHATFSGAGINVSKKTLEMPIKMITEVVRVTDPGDCPDFVSGDYSTLAKVQGWNKNNPSKRKIRYNSELTSIKSVPHKTRDWAQRMALDRIAGTLQEGAAQGMTSVRGQSSPFVDLAMGMKQEHTPFVDLALGPGTKLGE